VVVVFVLAVVVSDEELSVDMGSSSSSRSSMCTGVGEAWP